MRPQVQALHLLPRRLHPENQTLPGEGEQQAGGAAGGSEDGAERLLAGRRPGGGAGRGRPQEPAAGKRRRATRKRERLCQIPAGRWFVVLSVCGRRPRR